MLNEVKSRKAGLPKTNNKITFSSFSVIVVFIALLIVGAAFIPRLEIRYKQSRNLPVQTGIVPGGLSA
jgi:hypothetical protein